MRPLEGPQTLFAQCRADWAFFASMPGSGKTHALCMEVCRWYQLPSYTGVAMRSNYKDLVRGPTSLFGQLSAIGRHLGGRARQSPHPGVEWPQHRSSVLCLHGNTPLSSFDGIEIGVLALDEAAHFDWPMVSYIASSRMRSTSGVHPYLRGSVMPTADTWVHELARPWLDSDGFAKAEESGKVRWFFHDDQGLPRIYDTEQDAADAARAVDPALKPKSLSFIFAKTQDNSVLMAANPEYLSSLAQLAGHERDRLYYGCWEARPATSGMFDRTRWKIADKAPLPKDIVHSVRGWDLAATLPSDTSPDPDWTRGIRLDVDREGITWVSDVVSLRNRPGPVDDLICATARMDGPHVVQAFCRDPGGAGVRDEQHIRDILSKVVGCGPVRVQPAANKVALAKVWSSALSAGRMGVVRAHWMAPLMSELDAFPSKHVKDHDDQVDAISYAWRELPAAAPQTSFAAALSRITW